MGCRLLGDLFIATVPNAPLWCVLTIRWYLDTVYIRDTLKLLGLVSMPNVANLSAP